QGLAGHGAAHADRAAVGEDFDDGVDVLLGGQLLGPAALDGAAGEAGKTDVGDLHGYTKSRVRSFVPSGLVDCNKASRATQPRKAEGPGRPRSAFRQSPAGSRLDPRPRTTRRARMPSAKPRFLVEMKYDEAAEAYLRSLPPEHFMEATSQGRQREITVESLALLHRARPEVQYFNEL